MMTIREIGEMDFLGAKVKIFCDKERMKGEEFLCSFEEQNHGYSGFLYVDNVTGKITYPDNAVVPEQTEERKIVPKFVVCNKERLTGDLISAIQVSLAHAIEIKLKPNPKSLYSKEQN